MNLPPPLELTEVQCLLPLAQTGDQAALVKLAASCERIVARQASTFHSSYFSIPKPDFCQSARIGVLEAIRRCDPNRTDSFYGYVKWWVLNYCQRLSREMLDLPLTHAGPLVDLPILDEQPDEDADRPCLSDTVAAYLWILNPMERRIVTLYHGLDGQPALMFREVGERFGLTRQRVNLIYTEALTKLQRHFRKGEPAQLTA